MNTYYPEIRKKERSRLYLMVLVAFLPIILPLMILITMKSWIACIGGAAIGVYISFKLYQYIQIRMVVKCPICSDGILTENYANSPRGTDMNVEHKCNICEAFFIDAKLQNKT
jgi:hypothetical protein